MKMNQKWMILILLILGAMIASGCAASKETVMAYNEAKDAFQKATLAGAKKCAPCQYATAEAYLALADHEFKHSRRELEDLKAHIKLVKEKSLEALKLTPCEKPAPPTPPAPAPPTPPTPPPTPPGRLSNPYPLDHPHHPPHLNRLNCQYWIPSTSMPTRRTSIPQPPRRWTEMG